MINLVIAYGVIAVVLIAYTAAIYWRRRKIERTLQAE